MLRYLRARSAEWETWAGLALALAAAWWCWHRYRVEVQYLAVGAYGVLQAALPRHAPEILGCFLGGGWRNVVPSGLADRGVLMSVSPEASVASSDLVGEIEKAALAVIVNYGTSSALGAEESKLVQAILTAYRSKSPLDLVPVIEDVVDLVATLRAPPAAIVVHTGPTP